MYIQNKDRLANVENKKEVASGKKEVGEEQTAGMGLGDINDHVYEINKLQGYSVLHRGLQSCNNL